LLQEIQSAYQRELETILANDPHRAPNRVFGNVDDAFWYWLLTEGYRRNERQLTSILPAMPPEALQRNYTGTAGDEALQLAFPFYQLVRRLLTRHLDRPIESVLDFGCGWGRIIRFFLRDVDPQHLRGADCLQEAIDTCRSTNTHCRFELVEPLPPMPMEGDTFDLVYAYSVFSHLSEQAHLAWIEEFHRVLRPGGVLVVTTRPREFILMCAAMRATPDLPAWAMGAAMSFADTAACLARYDRGEFLYQPVGGGPVLDASIFGEACIPEAYVRRTWTRHLEFVDYIDDRKICEQNVIVMRRR
jgi:SAM-dependent methyltransferase